MRWVKAHKKWSTYLLSSGLLSFKEDVKNNSFIFLWGLVFHHFILQGKRTMFFLNISNVEIFRQHNVKTIFTGDLIL